MKEGDNATVGCDLCKLLLKERNTTAETPQPKAEIIIPQKEQSKPVPEETIASAERVPLIKFLGKRTHDAVPAPQKSVSVPPSIKDISATEPLHLHVSNPVESAALVVLAARPQKKGNRITYESMDQLPRRFRPRLYSEIESSCINVIYTS